MTTVINMLGGPGCGKSTTAAGLFHIMKLKGFDVELVTEYAKDKTWEESFMVLENQFYVLAKQEHRQWRASKQCEYIITDSALINSKAYTEEKWIHDAVDRLNARYNNVYIRLIRTKEYKTLGRSQNEDQARELDAVISKYDLGDSKVLEVNGGPLASRIIYDFLFRGSR